MIRQYSFLVFVSVIIFAFFITFEADPVVEVYKSITDTGTVKSVEMKENHLEIHTKKTLIKSYDKEQTVKPGDIIKFSGKLMSSEYYIQKYQNHSYTTYLKSRNINYICYPKSIEVTGHKKGIYSIRGGFIELLDGSIDRLYRSDSPIFKALFYGNKSEIDEFTRTSFSHTGTAHILALSGFHTGIILVFINFALMGISVRRRGAAACAILIIYAFLTGLRPSIIRAVAFFGIYYASFIKEQRYNLMSSAFITASLMAAVNPYYIYDVGYQLSFASVISIAMFMPVAQKYGIPPFISVTLSAQLLTLPIVIYYFNVMPLSGVAANFLVIPLISLAMALFMVSMIFYAVSMIIPFMLIFAKHISCGAIIIKDFMLRVNIVFENLPYSYLENIETDIWKIGLYYGIILVIYKVWEIKTIKENLYEFEKLPKIIT